MFYYLLGDGDVDWYGFSRKIFILFSKGKIDGQTWTDTVKQDE